MAVDRTAYNFDKNVFDLEKTFVAARVQDHKDMFSLAFRNTEVKQNIMSYGNINNNSGGHYDTKNTTENSTTTTTQE